MHTPLNVQVKKVDKGIRLTNYLVDQVVIILLWLLVSFFQGGTYYSTESFYIIMFLYYLILEAIFQKTLGKVVTKTVVTDKYGAKPGFLKVLIRSFLRLVPIDGISYLFGTEMGFHDVGSSTRLFRDAT